VEWRLSNRETQLLVHHLPTTFRARVDEVLLTALVLAWEGWTGCRALRVDLEGHGREDLFAGVDLSRTVGWFTTIFPVHLEAGLEDDPIDVLRRVGEQVRAVPRHGIGYGLLRFLSDPQHRAQLPSSAAVNFNYLGQLDRLWYGTEASPLRFFGPAEGPTGPWRASSGRRVYPLEIEAAVRRGKLTMRFRYSHHLHHRDTISKLAATCHRQLRKLIEHGSPRLTTSSLQPGDPHNPAQSDEHRPAHSHQNSHQNSHQGELEASYPTSPLQQGMLFHSLFAPASSLYREQSSWTITGPLNLATFRHVWQQLLARHPALRTAFSQIEPGPLMANVHRRVQLPLSVLDWRRLPATRRKSILPNLLRTERHRGFDLARPPLLRFLLIHLEENSWRFVWTLHHSLLDGWSISCLFDEFFILYEASAGQTPLASPALPEPPQFRDYITWLDSQALDTDFWHRHLSDLGPPTQPPGMVTATTKTITGTITGTTTNTDTETEAEPTLRERQLSAPDSAALQAFARRHHLTLNTVMQGAWALELGHAATTAAIGARKGDPEVIFGATLTHRPESLPGAERMVGLLLNTLPVRVRVTAQSRLQPWLRALQEQNLELRQRGHTSLPEARQAAGLPGNHPLFETLLAFQNYPGASRLRERRGSLQLGDLLYFNHSHYPLTLQVTPGDKLLIQARFDPRRFDETAVRRMLRRLTTRLSWIANQGQDLPLAAIPWLTSEEHHQILVEWNDRHLVRHPPSFHQLLARQVERTPEAIALVGEQASGQTSALCYGELARQSARIGHIFRAHGVGAESRVGLCLERSPEMMITILAVLRAGGAWLPLDPAYPPQRLALMVEDAHLSLLVVRPEIAATLDFPIDLPTLEPPSPWLYHHPQKPEDVVSQELASSEATSPQQLAYLIYTSGSTGRPKGAQVTLGGLAALAHAHPLATRPDDAVLQFASASFDASVFETFLALAAGATLHLAQADHLLPGEPLEELIKQRRISQVVLPPSALAALPLGAEERLPALRTVLVAGEACPAELGLRWRRGRNFINAYGPTETTICATAARWHEGSVENRPPIGRPILGTSTYLFDHHLNPVALGVPGELYIGGAGVGRGYWNRPALTAERFVPDPMTTTPGGRLYRTGDHVCHLTDGRLDFLGRLDHQMKLRGFRIEPGEIEAALRQHPTVADAIVGLSPTADPALEEAELGDGRLMAWVVAKDHPEQWQAKEEMVSSVRRHLNELLPTHMVPTAFVLLDRFPLTPNGKIDRAALRRLPAELRPSDSGGPPQDRFELAVAESWRQVLSLDNLGRSDHFFELGGHSLLATRVLAHLRQSLGITLLLRDLFEHPILEDLATRLRQVQDESPHRAADPTPDPFEEMIL
jgi:amino acid adenylation domain-containing protein/non-ribosomal peptide synthase protein (TIGR01720 family)